MARKTIVCSAYSLGYGPAAKLILLARELASLGLDPVFLGTGIAHELAARSPAFRDTVSVTPGDPLARRLLRSAAGLLSVMDRDYAAVALELGKPVYAADSLFWMRDRVPEAFLRARRYWVQDFIGVRRRVGETFVAPIIVGPIVDPVPPAPADQRTRLVINLGGAEAAYGSADDDPAYFDFVVRGILQAGLPDHSPETVLIAGDRCARYLRRRYTGSGIEFHSTSHEEAVLLVRSARLVWTAPGLTATLECFQQGVPSFFLPPQNYSQWLILKKLRTGGLAPASFHWEDAWPDCPVTERMPERTRVPLLREALGRLARDGQVLQTFRERLGDCFGLSCRELAQKQCAFFRSLGPNGARQIARDIALLCRGEASVRLEDRP